MSDLKTYQFYIDGEWCDAEGGKTFESIDPSTGKVWALMPEASEADVNRAVEAAERAMWSEPWSTMLPPQRAALLRKLADLMAENARHLGEVETRDTGKIIRETAGQAAYIAEYYRYFAGLCDKIEGSTLPLDKPDMIAMTVREPLGVVAAIVPWNSQQFLIANKLGPAIAAGNTVVLKASEDGPAPIFEFAKLVEEAGFPPGVVNVITGFGEPCGRALTSHPKVARVAFTGGPDTARHVIRNTAENFAVTSLELGGKSPFIVFEDADIESATNGVVAGIFGASGQSCVAGSRLFLQDSIHDQVIENIVDKASHIRIGDPQDSDTEFGPLCTMAQIEKIETNVAATLKAGGILRHGGNRPQGFDAGYYYAPTVIECPSPELAAVEEEMFGPVLSVLRFTDEDEVIAKANDTRYGLAGGIFTRDIGRALRVAKRLRNGITWINTYRVVSPVAPFGGFKMSGHGRESGLDSVHDYTRTKTIWINTSDAPMADPFVMR